MYYGQNKKTSVWKFRYVSTLKWSCFDLLWITFLWSTFHFSAGDLQFCKGTIYLKFCKVTPFRVQGWLTLGCKCTRTFKHRRGQKTLHTSGLEGSAAPLQCHFIRLNHRIMFCIPARFVYRGALIPKNSRNLLKILKWRSSWNTFSKNEKVPASFFFQTIRARNMFSLFDPTAMCYFRHCEIFFGY